MADLGGLGATEIHRVFQRGGLDPLPSVSTIKRWLYDDEEARRSIEYSAPRWHAPARRHRAGD
jgi:hypothetical protein